jgi:hypothetical protein
MRRPAAAARPEGETNLVPDKIGSSKPAASNVIPEHPARRDIALESQKNLEREEKNNHTMAYTIAAVLAGGVALGLIWMVLDLLISSNSKNTISNAGYLNPHYVN